MYRKSNRKSLLLSRNIRSPPYFHFRFGRQRPSWRSFLQYFGQYRRRIICDGQAIGPRGQGRLLDTNSGSDVSSWLASSVKWEFYNFLRLYVAPSSFGGIGSRVGSRGRWVEISGRRHISAQRPNDARFCSILANMAAVSFVMVRRWVHEVKVVRGIPLPVRSRLADSGVV